MLYKKQIWIAYKNWGNFEERGSSYQINKAALDILKDN